MRREVVDPRAVLLLAPVFEVLPHALRALAVPPAHAGDLGEGGLGDVTVGGVAFGCADRAAQRGIDRMDVGHVARRVVGGEPRAGGGVVRDRPAVGLVAADRELDRRHAERRHRGKDGAVGDAVDPGRAAIGHVPVGPVAPDPPADAIPCLEHDDALTGALQEARGGESRDPRSHDDRVDLGHDALLG